MHPDRLKRGALQTAKRAALAAFLIATISGAGAEPARPQRIVSINLCADELLLRLADRKRIASVTRLSQDAGNSNVAALAAGLPVNHGLAEEVMAMRPDVVLAGVYSPQNTVGILRRLGVNVVEFDIPNSLDDVRSEIRRLAAAIGEPERGEALVRAMDARFATLAQRAPAPPLRAVVLRPNGITAGKGSLVEDIMARAGLENLAARLDAGNYLQIPLEAVALQGADVLIVDGESDGPPSLATETLAHPIVAALGRRVRIVSMPAKLWTCGGPNLVEAAERLVAATRGGGGASAR